MEKRRGININRQALDQNEVCETSEKIIPVTGCELQEHHPQELAMLRNDFEQYAWAKSSQSYFLRFQPQFQKYSLLQHNFIPKNNQISSGHSQNKKDSCLNNCFLPSNPHTNQYYDIHDLQTYDAKPNHKYYHYENNVFLGEQGKLSRESCGIESKNNLDTPYSSISEANNSRTSVKSASQVSSLTHNLALKKKIQFRKYKEDHDCIFRSTKEESPFEGKPIQKYLYPNKVSSATIA